MQKMNHTMKKILFSIIFALSFGPLFAQSMFSLTYDMSLPLGETSDYIGSFSARGFGIEGRSFLSDNISVGGSFGWHIFYESTGNQTFEEDNLAVNGTQYRYINSFPLLVTGHYYTADDGDTRIYFGAGIGAVRVRQRTEMGLYAFENKSWTFGFAPEVGVLIPINFNNALNLAAKYQYALKAGDVDINVSYLSFKVGFAFM
jgi:opacity protein-like surface antigen